MGKEGLGYVPRKGPKTRFMREDGTFFYKCHDVNHKANVCPLVTPSRDGSLMLLKYDQIMQGGRTPVAQLATVIGRGIGGERGRREGDGHFGGRVSRRGERVKGRGEWLATYIIGAWSCRFVWGNDRQGRRGLGFQLTWVEVVAYRFGGDRGGGKR